MGNLTTFEIAAGTASILGGLIAVGAFSLKLLRTFRRKREDAERKLEQQLARLHAAGRTVSARTDLGFFVLIELASLRGSIANYRDTRTWFLLLGVLCGVIVGSVPTATPLYFLVKATSAVLCPVLVVLSLVLSVIEWRLDNYTNSYQRRIQEMWRRPIDKRVPPIDN